ncbi:unnamed protein product [Ceratitis capitata]|uniref:(Mediterranean fruit fly) hypothetical protein n=1 Tax=Ceratitis capitata TaxID=7213 RepID=A0A811V0J1_CERCA|nr:unnamed protein product [Ceratitis capitata]
MASSVFADDAERNFWKSWKNLLSPKYEKREKYATIILSEPNTSVNLKLQEGACKLITLE